MSDVKMIPVSTVPATEVATGMLQVTAATRVGKDKKEIPADQRSRSVIIPEFTPSVSSKYISLVTSALSSLAIKQLKVLWADSDPKEVQAALFKEDSLLAFAAREAESSRLTKESITDWWNGSSFKKHCLSKYNEKAVGGICARIQNLSAPTPSYTEKQCDQALALFGEVDGIEDDEFAGRLITKIENHRAKIVKEREALETSEAPF